MPNPICKCGTLTVIFIKKVFIIDEVQYFCPKCDRPHLDEWAGYFTKTEAKQAFEGKVPIVPEEDNFIEYPPLDIHRR